MTFRRISFTILFIFLYTIIVPKGFTSPFGTNWQIQIKDAAVVHKDMVTLKDIGEVHGKPPLGIWEKLSSISLWKSPEQEGVPVRITRPRLETALKEALGEAAALCILPTNLVIQKGGRVLNEDDLRKLTQKAIEEAYPPIKTQGELSDFRIPSYIFLPQKGYSVDVILPNISAKRLSLQFVVKDLAGTITRQYTGTVLLSLWKPVASTSKPLNRGDYVNPEEIVWLKKNIAFLRDDLWDGKGGPWQVKRSIGGEQPIYKSDLEPLDIVRKGAIIKLVYNKGGILLTTKAEAQEDGTIGQTISVRNLQSKKIIYAKIIDSNTVEIQ